MTTDARPFLLTDLPEEVREQVYDHVFSADDHEVGGVLVGAVGEDGRAEVHGMIPALEASSARASLTFTHEAWEQVLEIQERDFPDSPTIIGWYHSHPGFGIFLSEHDVFIHQNFFREPHQVAYVVDPQDETEGMFGWRNGRVELFEEGRTPRRRGRRRPGMVIELDPEDAAAAAAAGASAAVDLSQRSVPPTGQRHEIVVDDEAPSRRRRGLLPLAAGLALVLGVGAALVIGGRHDDAQTVASGGPPPIEKLGDPAAVANLNKRTRAQIAAAGSQAVGLGDQDQKRQDRYDQVKQQQDQQNQTSTDNQTQTTDQTQGTQTQTPQTQTPQTQTPQTQTPEPTTPAPRTTTTQAPPSGFGDN